MKDKGHTKRNPPSTSEGVELVRLLLTPHFSTLLIGLGNDVLPFIRDVTGVDIWDDNGGISPPLPW